MSKKRAKRATISEFRRDTKRIRQRLRRTGEPLLLTSRGKVEVVVQDVNAYLEMSRLAAKADRAETIAAIKEGIADVDAGRTRPAHEVLNEIAGRYGITLRSQ